MLWQSTSWHFFFFEQSNSFEILQFFPHSIAYYRLINILHTTLENKSKHTKMLNHWHGLQLTLYKIPIVLLTVTSSGFVFSCLPKSKYYKNMMTYMIQLENKHFTFYILQGINIHLLGVDRIGWNDIPLPVLSQWQANFLHSFSNSV